MEQALKILTVFDLSRFSKREHALVYVGIIMVFATAFNYLVLPKFREARVMESKIAGLRVEIDGLTKGVSSLQQAATQKSSAPVGIPVASPGESRVSILLQEITETARVGGVDFVAVRPMGITDMGGYLEMQVRVDMKSRYREVGEYLERLQALPRAIAVKDVRMDTTSSTDSRISTEIHLLVVMGTS